MDPVAPAVIRSAGTVTKAALDRYRPAGVARVGSAEDRAQSYRRLLDAFIQAGDMQILYYYRRRAVEDLRRIRQPLRYARLVSVRERAWHDYTQAQVELHAALLGVRLCAPAPVLAAAEDLVHAMPRFYYAGTRQTLPEEEYLAAVDERSAAQRAFLEASRHDLAYNPRPWQLLRKRRERKYREQTS